MNLIESLEDERLSSKINISNWKVLVDSLRATLTREATLRERAEKAKGALCRAREALLEHRADLHEGSTRPCPTYRKSAEALGFSGIVPNSCATEGWDKKAQAEPELRRRTKKENT